MTKRDLFRVLIKLLGLFYLTQAALLAPSTLAYSTYYGNLDLDTIIPIAFTIITLIVFTLIIMYADKVIDLLRLDKGYDDTKIVLGSLSSFGLLKLGIIIIGCYLVIDNASSILYNLYYIFKEQVAENAHYREMPRIDLTSFSINLITFIIGYLMMTQFTFIAKWFLKEEASDTPSK